ncbi:MAG: ABC transporter substrate-binding protein [Acidimicrobiaceae bacterium]|nr:ABC transporter substrate-binding protein [Acidimicrobiaceae bacterium]
MIVNLVVRKRRRAVSLPIAGFMALGLLLAACGSSGSSSTATTSSPNTTAAGSTTTAVPNLGTVTFSQVGPDAGKWPIYAAISQGFFKQEGISVSVSVSGSSPSGVQEVLANSVNIAEVGDTDAISGAAAGGSVVLVAGEENAPPYVINVPKSITSIAQLKGKKVSVAAPTNITKLYWNAIATANGLNPADVTYLYSPTTGDRFAALKGGVVQAAILLPPFSFEAAAQGYPAIASAAKYLPYPFTALAVNPTWASANSAKLLAFLKGYLLGVKWLYDPANQAAAISLLVSVTKTTQSAATQSYDFFVNQLKTFPTNGSLSDTEMAKVAQAMVGLGAFKQAPPTSKFLDTSYITKAAQQLGIS